VVTCNAALATLLAGRDGPGRLIDLAPEVGPEDAGTARDAQAPFDVLRARSQPLDAVVHLHLPDATTDAAALQDYCGWLRLMLTAALEHLRQTDAPGVVVNQFLMPTLLADHPLAAAMVETRNAIAGLTRFGCVKYGRAGIRVLGLLPGLLDLPGLRALASARVKGANTPLGRWITPQEVAGTLAFLSLDSGYMTGQMLVLDGGMTGGTNGV
jgi:NAD(P)-dependent dehydrogenase (short-subunit alcohol dehydrogenase family)